MKKYKKDVRRIDILTMSITFILFFVSTTLLGIYLGEITFFITMWIWIILGWFCLYKLIKRFK